MGMERVKAAEVKALVLGGSSEAATLSATRLDVALKLQVGEMLGQMAAAFPSQESHPDTALMYQHGVELLTSEFGIASVQAALESFLTRQKFFPHPSEVREALEAMATKARELARQQNPYVPDPTCKHVLPGQAWVLDKDGDRVIGECECHRRWRGTQAMQATKDHKAAAAGGT
jgi:hypothetical protein